MTAEEETPAWFVVLLVAGVFSVLVVFALFAL